MSHDSERRDASPRNAGNRVTPPVLEEEWVALDLETTGLEPDSHEIIEIGAVRFRGHETLDTFSSLVNPGRPLTEFIVGLTGITDEDLQSAPSISQVLPGLSDFVGASPLVGQNLQFDLGFLESAGLWLNNPTCDTMELAYVIRPGLGSYSLDSIAAELGVVYDRPHRALYDAVTTSRVFNELVREAQGLEFDILREIQRLAERSGSKMAYLYAGLLQTSLLKAMGDDGPKLGFGIDDIRRRLVIEKPTRTVRERIQIDLQAVASALQEGGELSRFMQGFEHRPQQQEMAQAVSETINESVGEGGARLIVEGGTGVGKSLAYLLPAALYALANDASVVISTNTINLQQQLLEKDIPLVYQALAAMGVADASALRATQLKGRSNYLCLERLLAMRGAEAPSEAEARFVAKLLVWLRETETGDQQEINFGRREWGEPWSRLSARVSCTCAAASRPCFLRAARDRAAASHLIVVNHALLMSNVATGGSILPAHDVLIIDEAHHLEEAATSSLGTEVSLRNLTDQISAVLGADGLMARATSALSSRTPSDPHRQRITALAGDAGDKQAIMRSSITELMRGAGRLVAGAETDGYSGGKGSRKQLRVSSATRTQPAWTELEARWERADVALEELSDIIRNVATVLGSVDDAEMEDISGQPAVRNMADVLATDNDEIRERLRCFFPSPEPETVYWMTTAQAPGRRSGTEVTLQAAPLSVGEKLEDGVYSQTAAVVMTSATLAADGRFDHLVDRTGFDHARHEIVGSPFDYERAALVCLPSDIPEPNSTGYEENLQRAIVNAAVAAGGRTMALFTSYKSLRQADKAVRPELARHGIDVHAQGANGSPRQITDRFKQDPRSVILGTASFWEGVDLSGEALQVLLVARLPFPVPSDPIIKARSELFEDAFSGFHMPQAILRLRQGFGRLIRTGKDRGVVVILDRRIVTKRYGRAFTRSLPPARLAQMPLAEVSGSIRRFLQ